MFNINEFLMKTIKGMIGNYPDFQVREYAIGWWSKGKLTDADMEEIDTLIEAQYIVPEPPQVDEPIEDLPEDVEEEPTETDEIENETILDAEGTEEPTEIIEDSTIEEELPETESTEQTTEEVIEEPGEEIPEEEPTEPTE